MRVKQWRQLCDITEFAEGGQGEDIKESFQFSCVCTSSSFFDMQMGEIRSCKLAMAEPGL